MDCLYDFARLTLMTFVLAKHLGMHWFDSWRLNGYATASAARSLLMKLHFEQEDWMFVEDIPEDCFSERLSHFLVAREAVG